MRYKIFGIGLAVALAVFVSACQEKTEPDPEINFTGDSVALASSGKEFQSGGGEFTLSFNCSASWTAAAVQEDGTPASWIEIYPSSGEAGDGKVSVLVSPNTTLKVRSAEVSIRSGKVSESMKVKVAAKAKVEPESLSFDNEAELIFTGSALVLNLNVKPEGADVLDEFVWASSNEDVAVVSRSGRVKALAPGTADISATAGALSAVCHITVRDFISLKEISLNQTETITLDKGEKATLIATPVPADADEVSFEWETSNRKVATVRDGEVTAVSSGDALISVYSGSISASVKVHVIQHVVSVSISHSSINIERSRTVTLQAVVNPGNADDKSLTWTSDDESIATVDENGVVTGIKLGKTTVRVFAEGGKTDSCEVNVVDKVGSGGENLDDPIDVNPWN